MNAFATRRASVSEPIGPTIDSAQALWAIRELETLVDQLGADSPVAMVFRHARQELVSLMNAEEPSIVLGPFRVAA